MKKPSGIERISDNLLTRAGLTLIATAAGTPLAALLPMLADSLAGRRHAARLEATLNEVHSILRTHEEKLEEITDSQYKLLNETILAIMQNTEDAKLDYLRKAISGGIEAREITQTAAAQVSRALRDMTAGELDFVISHVSSEIMVGPVTGDIDEDIYVVDRRTNEISYVSGLLGLGVLVPAGSTMDDAGRYVFAPFVRELCQLVR